MPQFYKNAKTYILEDLIKYIHIENKYFSSSIAIACVGQKYEKVSGKSYLTFEFSDKKISKRIIINENSLMSELSQDNVDEMFHLSEFFKIGGIQN